jgi:cytoskeletal protein CcmA (bactofilin family)
MKKPATITNSTSLIAKGMEFQGDLRFSGILEIEGLVVGNVIAVDESTTEVRIRETGVVKGLINVPVVIVNGVVEGDIYCSNHMELAAKARVTGSVYYHLLEMVLGCVVRGTLTHMASNEIMKTRKQLQMVDAN